MRYCTVINRKLKIGEGILTMPDKNPKNLKKIKERAEVKHEEVKEWRRETPTEKQLSHKHEDGKKKTQLGDP